VPATVDGGDDVVADTSVVVDAVVVADVSAVMDRESLSGRRKTTPAMMSAAAVPKTMINRRGGAFLGSTASTAGARVDSALWRLAVSSSNDE